MFLRVDGIPITQGSKTGYPIRRKDGSLGVRLTEGKKAPALKEWRLAIAAAARAWIALNGHPPPLDGPLEVAMTFYLPKPASASQKVKKPSKKPDVGKLTRAAEDALTGIAYVDDSRITTAHLKKRFAVNRPPGVEITIGPDESD